ncbi:uncharacterized protein METZ01_LOCUS145059 [marine metagenome]|uniref:HMA domain-containing protein n=1 Tax=marine metagenome TaxID=408172 RepID=A0A381ZSE9_9ZZZZ|tara:strand:+ start:334 stop:705 length:372 start_codon:yes stop_codon:yes gene_type:complete
MKKTSFFAIIIIAMVILVGGTYEAETVETASISVEGMRCGACCTKVETALASQNGVKTVSVNLETKFATVEFYPAKVAKSELVQAVSDAGFAVNEAACEYSSEKAKVAAEGAACNLKSKKKAI